MELRWEGDEVPVLYHEHELRENCNDHDPRDIAGGGGCDDGDGGDTLNVAMIDLTFLMSVQSRVPSL